MATPLPPEVLPPDYEALGSIGGLLTPREDYIPNLQSVYGDIVQNAADYQYFTAPLSNQGRTTASYGTGNNLVVAPDTPVRLVNNATGEVVYSGVGYEGAQAAIDAANALSSSAGKKANWDIQVAGPTMQGFQSVSTDRPDVSGLGIVADVALPVIGSVLAGPLGAAAGSGLSSAAQGRSLEDSLLRAAIAGGGSYLGGQLFGGPTTSATGATGGINADLIPNALEGLNFGSIASTAVPSGVGGAAGDIIVNAIRNTAPSVFGSVAGSTLGLAPSLVSGPSYAPDEIVVTAKQQPDLNLGGSIGSLLPSVVTPATPTTPPADITMAPDITVTAPPGTNVITPPVIPPVFGGSTTTGPGSTTTTKDNGVLGTGLTVSQLATLGTLGLGGLSSLLGGSGGAGTTTTTPYVSPFGALGGGMGMGAGMDYRANPNIVDYERYGFGPEAAFFRPEYNRLVSTGASMGSPAPAPAPQQQYTPLI